jgi:DNA-binding MarR family transcriptional regulator
MMDSGIGEAMQGWESAPSDATPATLVIAEAGVEHSPEHAVAAAGGRVQGRVSWHEARERLERQGPLAVVLAEARGASDAALTPVLPLLDAIGRRGGARIVVTLDVEQIDVLSATLCGPGIELLCAPSEVECVAALCIAGLRSGDRMHDVSRNAEAVRLQRLNQEVARIAETLARLTRGEVDTRQGDRRSGGVGEPTPGYRAPPPASDTFEMTARDIRETIRARRLRDQYFGSGLFEDPAWDMMLDLFAAELERAQVSVSSLCIAAAVAPTTALRWIARMTEAGLFERQPDPFDRRRAFLGLSDRASLGMRNYVAAVGRSGLAIA